MKTNYVDRFARNHGYPDYGTYNAACTASGKSQAPKLPPLEEEDMPFKNGQKVRIKGTQYTGTLTSGGGNGLAWVKRTEDRAHMLLPTDLLENVVDPQLGDIYRDKDGHEWIVIADTFWRNQGNVVLICIDGEDKPQHYSAPGKADSRSVDNWITKYEPVLARRRES